MLSSEALRLLLCPSWSPIVGWPPRVPIPFLVDSSLRSAAPILMPFLLFAFSPFILPIYREGFLDLLLTLSRCSVLIILRADGFWFLTRVWEQVSATSYSSAISMHLSSVLQLLVDLLSNWQRHS